MTSEYMTDPWNQVLFIVMFIVIFFGGFIVWNLLAYWLDKKEEDQGK